MFVEVGPSGIVVTGEKDGRPFDFDREEVSACLVRLLTDIRDWLPVLRQKGYRIKKTGVMPEVARIMVEAVRKVDAMTLTPMAAVAGAVADMVREQLMKREPDFVSINNGGDISIFNRSGRAVRIGLGDIAFDEAIRHVLSIRSLTAYGLATSGFGGRSFTLGLADKVTVIAATSALADAAATRICNATTVETDRVKRRRAAEIDPATDIPDELVTIEVGKLDEEQVSGALSNGLTYATALKGGQVIIDAMLFLGGRWVTTMESDKNIYVEVDHGDQKACHNCGGHIC